MSTPPLSRNNLSSSLNPNDQLYEKKLSQQNVQQQKGDSIQAEINQLESGRDKTWKGAQGKAGIHDRPRLQNKRSQPILFNGADSLPNSSSHTPPVARDVNLTPTKISTSTTDASNPPVVTPPTSQSSGSSSSSSYAIGSPNEKRVTKNELQGDKLTEMVRQIINLGFQKDYILSPEKLAHLMIAVENQCGKKMVSAITSKSILREPLVIVNYQTASGVQYKSIDIIEVFYEPFIKYHLDHQKLDELLQKVMREYLKVGAKVTKLSEGLRPVEQVNHPDIVALMAPVMKLVGDYFFGSTMQLVSSKFPEPIKKLLLEIDRQIIAWFGKTEGGEMKDLLQLRKSALVGFISTFSFMTIWAPKLAADTKNGAGFYAKLSSYINSYLINKIDAFVIDILINQEHQSKKVKNYVSAFAKDQPLTPQSTAKLQLVGVEKGSVLSSIKSLFSPRASSNSHSRGTARETADEDSGFNEEAARQSEMQRKRIARLTEFAKTAGFDKISSEFFVLIRNKIIDLKAKDYNAFTKDPIAYCHQQLEAFKMQNDEKNTDSELFAKIETSINSYHENLERKNETEQALRQSYLMTQNKSASKNSGESEQVDDKSEATESSSSVIEEKVAAKDNDVQTTLIQASEKTESDSSTSVETEKSDD